MPSAFDVSPIDGSSLALEMRTVQEGAAARVGHETSDSLVYIGSGTTESSPPLSALASFGGVWGFRVAV